MKTTINKLAVLFLFTIAFTSCSSDDDNPLVINEEETITTVRLTVLESGTTASQVYTWTEDNQDAITLSANSSYNFKIEFLDESNPSDVEDITAEVIEERDEHYVFYETTVTGLSFTNASDDTIDGDNIGINISTDWSSTDAATGIVRAFLIHEPTTKTGDSRDDFGGETDIEVTFNVTVQ
ncbi:type 1 periplasmic binding fold superfamily protein [Aquimarina sp. 2201CG14-23]|uniref:type 1 periplasmic binding fold superfamily protein n=1 Tax=Aquimarina mycalae TaxID=3040073 RepID=UPI002477F7D7|nr:type 1 periplasmic binding fold superfamily protein [Aquimarina sp. 2201CG14-23]MDH7446230.1 type 1 periplasmic binding fold superfamily protein [Aquimarina sp. 2201CG14-23]